MLGPHPRDSRRPGGQSRDEEQRKKERERERENWRLWIGGNERGTRISLGIVMHSALARNNAGPPLSFMRPPVFWLAPVTVAPSHRAGYHCPTVIPLPRTARVHHEPPTLLVQSNGPTSPFPTPSPRTQLPLEFQDFLRRIRRALPFVLFFPLTSAWRLSSLFFFFFF